MIPISNLFRQNLHRSDNLKLTLEEFTHEVITEATKFLIEAPKTALLNPVVRPLQIGGAPSPPLAPRHINPMQDAKGFCAEHCLDLTSMFSNQAILCESLEKVNASCEEFDVPDDPNDDNISDANDPSEGSGSSPNVAANAAQPGSRLSGQIRTLELVS
uniref:Uncharacterized protein n=1 Tax=Melanopsichium pennsylvanicum 4 TaxID=1398559 RepID=A0A077QVB9_9BASI|nr:uncharacterized protein BN887_06148 [Melanopsichium pennsylvanicum 4]